MSFSTAFFLLFCASCAGIAYLLLKSAPLLSRLPQESLIHQETFVAWIARLFKSLFLSLNPRRIKRYALGHAADALNAMRVFFQKIYHTIETMAKTAREKSQRMDWEHRWFSPHEVARRKKEETDQKHE